MIVILPTPGPPVMTRALAVRATARRPAGSRPGSGRSAAQSKAGPCLRRSRATARCPRRGCAGGLGFELLPVRAVVDPFAQSRDPLTGRNGCGLADHRHEVTFPARLGAQESILGIVIGDPLDEAGQDFMCGSGSGGAGTHAAHGVPFLSVSAMPEQGLSRPLRAFLPNIARNTERPPRTSIPKKLICRLNIFRQWRCLRRIILQGMCTR
jgi:hypothetical protein